MVSPFLTPLLLLGRLTAVFALPDSQSQLPAPLEDALAAYPDCAVPCITTAFVGQLCSLTDEGCICNDPSFKNNVTTCVESSCTIPDALVTKNASLTRCDSPVRDRSEVLAHVSHPLMAFAGFSVALRFAYKLFAQLDIGLDDWFILATLLALIPAAVLNIHGLVDHGLGRDIWTLAPEDITHVLRYFFIMSCLYFIITSFSKLALIFFYLRIFIQKSAQRLLWASTVFTSLWGLSYLIAAVFQCRPISYFWNSWDGLHEGQCLSAHSIVWSHAAINIAVDLWILMIPLWGLRGLQLHWKKKVSVGLMFMVGIFVTAMSVLRLRSLVAFSASSNITWEFLNVSIWSAIELTVAVICACMPQMRLVLVRIFPVLSGNTTRRTNGISNRYNNGRSNLSGWSHHREPSYSHPNYNPQHGHSTHVGTSNNYVSRKESSTGRSIGESDEDPRDRDGITLQMTYAVQHSDNDDIGLVTMDRLDSEERHRG